MLSSKSALNVKLCEAQINSSFKRDLSGVTPSCKMTRSRRRPVWAPGSWHAPFGPTVGIPVEFDAAKRRPSQRKPLAQHRGWKTLSLCCEIVRCQSLASWEKPMINRPIMIRWCVCLKTEDEAHHFRPLKNSTSDDEPKEMRRPILRQTHIQDIKVLLNVFCFFDAWGGASLHSSKWSKCAASDWGLPLATAATGEPRFSLNNPQERLGTEFSLHFKNFWRVEMTMFALHFQGLKGNVAIFFPHALYQFGFIILITICVCASMGQNYQPRNWLSTIYKWQTLRVRQYLKFDP